MKPNPKPPARQNPIAAFREFSSRLQAEKKRLRRKLFLLKVKFTAFVVFPVLLLLLAAETVRVLLRSELRRQPEKAPGSPARAVPVSLVSFRPRFITPEPVKNETAAS